MAAPGTAAAVPWAACDVAEVPAPDAAGAGLLLPCIEAVCTEERGEGGAGGGVSAVEGGSPALRM